MTIMKIDRRREAYLGDAIMEQILLKLPIKSLVRFRSVGKHWLSLISHPSFVESHLKLVLSNEKIMTLFPSSSDFNVLNLENVQQHKYSLPITVKPGCRFRLMGSCNGLICLGIYSYSMLFNSFSPILWNPLLNDYKQVPFRILRFMNRFGFGYDLHTQDYKLVRVDVMKGVTEVYRLKSISMGVVPIDFEQLGIGPGCGFYNFFGVYMNGSLYWLHSITPLEFGFIVFNLRYENFTLLKFPNNICTLPIQRAAFSSIVRDSQLDVFFYNPKDNFFNLVTMKEDNMNGTISWSSITIQNPGPGIVECWPICVMINGDIVMEFKYDDFPSQDNYQRIIYNPKQRSFEHISTIHKGAENLQAEYTTYIETLISPSNLINCSARCDEEEEEEEEEIWKWMWMSVT